MLLQSHEGEIAFLPALPKAWAAGKVTGLCARRGLEVDITWSNGLATEAVLRTRLTHDHVLRPPKGQRIANVSRGGKQIPGVAADDTVHIRLAADMSYRVGFA